MSWRVGFEPMAAKELAALDSGVCARVMKALARLAADPRRAANVKALESGGGVQRLRAGDWRVVYTLKDE